MKIKINDIESFRTPDSFVMKIDDRQQRVEVFGGTVIQDLGIGGNSFSVTAVFKAEDFIELLGLWSNRTAVTFTDESGRVWDNCRIFLDSYKYVSRFYDYVTATFEIWQLMEGF